VRATPPARALAFLVDVLDRYWGILGFAVAIGLATFVFAPRDSQGGVVGCAIVGAALLVGWLWARPD
jgi:hypothetical protein